MKRHDKLAETIPVGNLGILALESSKEMGQRVNDYIVEWRQERSRMEAPASSIAGYSKDSYLIDCVCPRFGSGEAKGLIRESVRGDDLFLLVDVCNYSLTYKVCGQVNHMSPDDHYQDLKRLIAAVGGKARRITVMMPFLYESRQHRRSSRESLDCALALQELTQMGVESIITFDAHDPRVQNAIPLKSFETVQPTYQFIKALLKNVPDIRIDAQNLMVISPDEGALGRAVYYANVLGIDVGMFYKRRDYSKIVDGRNPIVAHEYLGTPVEGKDVFVADDIISSGESVLDIAENVKARKARRFFAYGTYAIFTNGLAKFDKAYEEGLIDGIFGSNLTYLNPELKNRPWFHEVDVSKYIAYFISALNHDASISSLLDPHAKIDALLQKRALEKAKIIDEQL